MRFLERERLRSCGTDCNPVWEISTGGALTPRREAVSRRLVPRAATLQRLARPAHRAPHRRACNKKSPRNSSTYARAGLRRLRGAIHATRPIHPNRRLAVASSRQRLRGVVRSRRFAYILRVPGIYSADRLHFRGSQRHARCAPKTRVRQPRARRLPRAQASSGPASRDANRRYNAVDDAPQRLGDTSTSWRLSSCPAAAHRTRRGAPTYLTELYSFMNESRRLSNDRLSRAQGRAALSSVHDGSSRSPRRSP